MSEDKGIAFDGRKVLKDGKPFRPTRKDAERLGKEGKFNERND